MKDILFAKLFWWRYQSTDVLLVLYSDMQGNHIHFHHALLVQRFFSVVHSYWFELVFVLIYHNFLQIPGQRMLQFLIMHRMQLYVFFLVELGNMQIDTLACIFDCARALVYSAGGLS